MLMMRLGTHYRNGIDTAVGTHGTGCSFKVFNADKTLNASYNMTEDAATGIWHHSGDLALDRLFYRFELDLYHYETKAIETIWSTDPYSVSLGVNGRFSQFANLMDADLYPEGWDTQTVATLTNPEDGVIYEGHVRDFSALDESTTEANRGKYLAFTETDSVPVSYLKDLADAVVSYFHLLPTNDIATVKKTSTSVSLSNTVAEFVTRCGIV